MTFFRSILFALALVAVTPPYAIVALLTFPLPRHARYRIISGWSRLVVYLARFLCGIRWRVLGRENLPPGPAVILANHQSAWETLAFQLIFPDQVLVLKRELLWLPFFGWGLALMSPIAIDRRRGPRALRAMARRGRERIEQGFWIVVFPEGTRVMPGERRDYQVGGAWLAAQCGVPIVPVAHDAGKLWRRNAFLKRPGTVTVRIGPAIDATKVEPLRALEAARGWIESGMVPGTATSAETRAMDAG
jgi:1-acyl-sn-glycerol-3-phosphate acyltransferase